MSLYNTKFNKDDSVVRHIIIGLLADLNKKIFFYRQLNNEDRVKVDIPFYYTIGSDDQFLRDAFLFSTSNGPTNTPSGQYADGNYDQIPRGVVDLTGLNINSSNMVNKRNPGEYTKLNQQGSIESYRAEFEAIPIVLNANVEILVSSLIDYLKVIEIVIKKLYKSNYYNVEAGHLDEAVYKLPAYYAMPDNYEVKKPIDFTFEDKEDYKITLPLEINTHLAAFEWETEQHAGNRMYQINNNINPSTDLNSSQTTDKNIIKKNDI